MSYSRFDTNNYAQGAKKNETKAKKLKIMCIDAVTLPEFVTSQGIENNMHWCCYSTRIFQILEHLVELQHLACLLKL